MAGDVWMMGWARLPKSRLSLEQRLNYVESGLEVDAGLEEAVRLLRLKGIIASDDRSRNRLIRSADAFEADRASVRVDLIAYLDERTEVCPLDDRSADIIRARFELLLGLTPQAATHVIVGLAQDLVDGWGGTRPLALTIAKGRAGGRGSPGLPPNLRPGSGEGVER